MSHTLELTPDILPRLHGTLPEDYWDGELVSRSDSRSGIVSANMERVSGTPCFVGTRVPIRNLWDHLEEGLSMDDFLDGFPVSPETKLRPRFALRGASFGRDAAGHLPPMNILLDHCLNWRLKRYLPGHSTVATFEMGWDTIRNGQLLTLAEEQFDVFLTVDKGIKYQQNMTGRTIVVITLRAINNSIVAHAPLMPQVLALLPTVEPGRVYIVTEMAEQGSP